jgi:ribosome-binding protein aMBF1 (putative translation factor)
MKVKEIQENLAATMKSWQKVENAAIASTAKVMEKTGNPVKEVVRMSLEDEALSLTPEELSEIWDMVEQHIKIEKKTLGLAREALSAIKGKKMVVQEYLLDYLMKDEEKHNTLLENLEKIKSGMYPYG